MLIFFIQEYIERGDENSLIIERILMLIRNILYIPADYDAEKRPDDDANVHDQVNLIYGMKCTFCTTIGNVNYFHLHKTNY